MSRFILGCLLLVLATGCYNRKALPVRQDEPRARVYIEFHQAPNLVEVLMGANVNGQSQMAFNSMSENLIARVRADLLRLRMAQPVSDPEANVDLVLTGVFRPASMGVDLEWQLVDARTKAAVSGGIASDFVVTGNVEPFADQVLEPLSALDLNRYAGGAGPSTQVAATNPTTTPTPSTLTMPASATDGSKAFAVVVGIGRYREALPEATHAEDDARAFAAFAEKTLGVPPAHIKVLLGDRAGRADLASALEEWLPRNARERGGRVYVFFSGHGAPDPETGDTYLVPYDGDPAYLKTRGLAVSHLYGALDKLKDQHVYVFLDACFSGGGSRSVLAQGTRPLVPIKVASVPAQVVALTAAGPAQTTGEATGQGHGLFTWHLLQGLAGSADANRDANVTFAELAEHVQRKVETEARLANREQSPVALSPRGFDGQRAVLVQGLR